MNLQKIDKIRMCHTQGLIGHITKLIDYINVLQFPIDSLINNYLLWFYYYYN